MKNKSIPSCYIFDIDGTLAERSLERDKRDYTKVELDSPISQTLELLNYYSGILLPGDKIFFISGRKQSCYNSTEKWLQHHSKNLSRIHPVTDEVEYNFSDLSPSDYSIFLRSDNDHRKDFVLKREIYENNIKDKYDIKIIFEDRPRICKMWRDLGLFVMQVGAKDDF